MDFRTSIQNTRLSAQAKRVLLTRTASFEEFLLLRAEEITEFKNLQDCEHITALELLKFQKELQRKFNVKPLQAAEKLAPEEDTLNFEHLVNEADLSIRATGVLLQNVPTLQMFLELNELDIFNFKNCGPKTAQEILHFQSTLMGESETAKSDNFAQHEAQTTLTEHLSPPEDISRIDYLLDEITVLLSERARKVLEAHSVDSLERFMALPVSAMERMKNCGHKCIVEYTTYQKHVRQLLQKIHDYHPAGKSAIQNCDELSPSLVYQFFDDIMMDGYEQINLENPFPSLKRWIAEIYSDSEKGQTAFMLRMGMLGDVPLTLEDVGQQLEGLSRERIRQIVEKAELSAKHRFHQKRLSPLVQKMADTVASRGGSINKATLVSLVLARGKGGENLQYAIGFIDFLSSLELWNDTGLHIDGDDVVISS